MVSDRANDQTKMETKLDHDTADTAAETDLLPLAHHAWRGKGDSAHGTAENGRQDEAVHVKRKHSRASIIMAEGSADEVLLATNVKKKASAAHDALLERIRRRSKDRLNVSGRRNSKLEVTKHCGCRSTAPRVFFDQILVTALTLIYGTLYMCVRVWLYFQYDWLGAKRKNSYAQLYKNMAELPIYIPIAAWMLTGLTLLSMLRLFAGNISHHVVKKLLRTPQVIQVRRFRLQKSPSLFHANENSHLQKPYFATFVMNRFSL